MAVASGTERSNGRESFAAGLVVLMASALAALIVGLGEVWGSGEWLGAAGVVVSLAGFTVALSEIRKTQNAAVATRAAIGETLRGVAASRLGIVIIQLRELADDFEEAANAVDSERARPALTAWRHTATEAKTLVRRRFGPDHQVLSLVDESIEIARATKSQIFEHGLSAADAKQCLAAMEKALDSLGPLLEQLFPTGDETDSG